ncbi:MAG: 2Fe-2S iron-sulfur cluster binding domain-containing protein [Rhodanobacter sp.]|jgi:ferredoxin|nr:2Fe-2S iron-sulfur cluster binding domain-containing protein [Rhodanobacter sp.]
MTAYTILIEDTGESYRCADHRSVLQGMEALGKKGIPAGCRQGGCGVCKVQVAQGSFSKRVMSREHVSAEEEAIGCVLSCCIKPTSDLRLSVIGKMKKNVCRTVEPAGVRPVYST